MERMLIIMWICVQAIAMTGCLQTPAPTPVTVTATKGTAEIISISDDGSRSLIGTLKNTGTITISNVLVAANIYTTSSQAVIFGTEIATLDNVTELKAGESDTFRIYFSTDRINSGYLKNYKTKIYFD
jgi:hypothetical protein